MTHPIKTATDFENDQKCRSQRLQIDFRLASIKIVFVFTNSTKNLVNNFNLFLHLMVFTVFHRVFRARDRYADVKLKFINKLAAERQITAINSMPSGGITRNYAIFQCATWLRHKRDFRHRNVLNSVTCLEGRERRRKRERKKNSKAIAFKLSSETTLH